MYKKAKIQVTVGATKEIWECQTYLRPRFHWCLTCLQNINHIFICKLTVSFFFQDSWQNHTSNLRFNLTSSLTHKLNKINKLKQNKDIISQRSKETQKVKQLTWSKEFLLVKKKRSHSLSIKTYIQTFSYERNPLNGPTQANTHDEEIFTTDKSFGTSKNPSSAPSCTRDRFLK